MTKQDFFDEVIAPVCMVLTFAVYFGSLFW